MTRAATRRGDDDLANQIEIELRDERVSITLRPEVEEWTKTRNITIPSALKLASLMLKSGFLQDTMTIEGDPEVVCQVLGGPEQYAWIGISQWGYAGDPDLIGCLEGATVREIGQGLHDLCLRATEPEQIPAEQRIFVRAITGFYLLDDDGEHTLTDVMPAHR